MCERDREMNRDEIRGTETLRGGGKRGGGGDKGKFQGSQAIWKSMQEELARREGAERGRESEREKGGGR